MLKIPVSVDCMSIKYPENSETVFNKISEEIRQASYPNIVEITISVDDYNCFYFSSMKNYVTSLIYKITHLDYYTEVHETTNRRFGAISTYTAKFVIRKDSFFSAKTKFVDDFNLFKMFLNSGVLYTKFDKKGYIESNNCVYFDEFRNFLDQLSKVQINEGVLVKFKKISPLRFNITEFEKVVRSISLRCNKSLVFNKISESTITFEVDEFSYTNNMILGLL